MKFPFFFDPNALVLFYRDSEALLVVLRSGVSSPEYSVLSYSRYWHYHFSTFICTSVSELRGVLKVIVEADFGISFCDLSVFDPVVARGLNVDVSDLASLEDYV